MDDMEKAVNRMFDLVLLKLRMKEKDKNNYKPETIEIIGEYLDKKSTLAPKKDKE